MTIKSLYPASRPALGIDFAKTKRLDPRITFTRASTGTFVDNGGVIRTAASGVARFDHTGTGESLGLLIQPAATNDHWYSNLFSNSGSGGSNPKWQVFTAVTLQEQQHPDPAGGNAATRIIPTTASSTHAIGRYSTYNTGNYAHSFFVKPQGYSRIGVNINGSGPTINLSTKTSSGSNSTVYFDKIEELANGWLRVTCIWANFPGGGGANEMQPAIYILDDSGNITFAGDGVKGIDIYGFQREAGTTSSSYIATGGGQATRAADVATLSNANSSIFPTSAFTTVNTPFGTAGGGSTVKLVGPTVKRTAIYAGDLTQAQINTLAGVNDGFWRWRVLGDSFALPNFTTDGSVTVDWGDGVVETLTTAVHTFTNGGGYHDIGFRLNSGTFFKPNINANATYKDRVIAVGPAPASMRINGEAAFQGCGSLRSFDATVDATGGTSFSSAWYGCSSLASFPLINTAGGTTFYQAWHSCSSLTSFPLVNTANATNVSAAWFNCSGLTSFPLINTAAVTNFYEAWKGCSSLTSFPLINTASGTTFQNAWQSCSGLASFPLINTGAGTNFYLAWANCSSLTSFPLINTGAGTNFRAAWYGCSSLTSFPLINTAAGTNFLDAWQGCSSLTSFPLINIAASTQFGYAWVNCTNLANFPANFFDAWTATPENDCFYRTWDGCASLTPASVVNILDSIALSGRSAPGGVGPSNREITIDWNGTGTPAVTSAVAITTLKSRNWTIVLNGVLQ